jgi:hypothetical protein
MSLGVGISTHPTWPTLPQSFSPAKSEGAETIACGVVFAPFVLTLSAFSYMLLTASPFFR